MKETLYSLQGVVLLFLDSRGSTARGSFRIFFQVFGVVGHSTAKATLEMRYNPAAHMRYFVVSVHSGLPKRWSPASSSCRVHTKGIMPQHALLRRVPGRFLRLISRRL